MEEWPSHPESLVDESEGELDREMVWVSLAELQAESVIQLEAPVEEEKILLGRRALLDGTFWRWE